MEKLYSDLYRVKVGENEVKSNFARVSKMPFNRYFPGYQRDISQTEEAAFVSFESENYPVTLEIEVNNDFSKVTVRPLSEKIKARTCGKTISFEISHPGQYVVEPYGLHNALHIFANPKKDFLFNADEKNSLYFGAGVHHPGVIRLKDNMTVYIDKEAVVYGAFEGVGVKNVSICGYGVIDGGFFERTSENYLLAIDYRRFPDGNWEKEQMRTVRKFDESKFPAASQSTNTRGSKIYESKDAFEILLDEFNTVKTGLHLYNCENVKVEGVIFRNSAGLTATSAGCRNIVFDNIKMIGMWRYNSDGVDFYNCSDCTVKNSFFRNFDDCICVKGQIGWDTEKSSNITVENCVVWADWGCSLEIGVDTVADEIEGIVFVDCDCLHNFSRVLSIGEGDRAKIHNVRFENIRVEYTDEDTKGMIQKSDDLCFSPVYAYAPLIQLHIYSGEWSEDTEGGEIYDVIFKDISVYTESEERFPKINIEGMNKNHLCQNITLENITHNGRKICDLSVNKNEFTKNITVK